MNSNTERTNTENRSEKLRTAPKFRHTYNAPKVDHEVNNEPSKTIPDMNLSMRELLINHTRGIGIDAKHYEGEYFEDEVIPVITDLNDHAEYREQLKNRQLDLEDEIAEMQKRHTARTEALKKQNEVDQAEKAKTLANTPQTFPEDVN